VIRTALISLAVPAAATAAVIPVAGFSSDWTVSMVFAAGAVLSGTAAFIGYRLLPGQGPEPTRRMQLATVAFAWIVVAVACSAVTWIAVRVSADSAGATALRDPMSTVFEVTSGASTTGLTMLADPSEAQPWLQWWRSLLQWFGAIGVVAFAVNVAEPSGDQDSVMDAEWGLTPGHDGGTTIRHLVLVLVALTGACALALLAAGEPVWRSVNHAMTAASTGGFTITSDSAASSGPTAKIILAATLLISAVSFGTIWDAAARNGRPPWKRTQVRWGLAVTTVACVAALAVGIGYAPASSIVFDTISAATTGGFAVGDAYRTVVALGVIAMVVMVIGGAAGSTAGGIKVARFVWLVKAADRWASGDLTEIDRKSTTWDGEEVDADTARNRIAGAASIAMLWLVTVTTATLLLAVANRSTPLDDIVFEAISASSGVGLSSGLAVDSANGATKSILTILMLAGRVEIVAFVIIGLKPLLDRRGR